MTTDQPDVTNPGNRNIRQLTSAFNFSAVFFDEENGEPWVDTIVAWAVVDSPGNASSQTVIGLVADGKDILFVDEFPNFLGYLSAESTIDSWRDRAMDAFEQQQSNSGERRGGEKRRGDL